MALEDSEVQASMQRMIDKHGAGAASIVSITSTIVDLIQDADLPEEMERPLLMHMTQTAALMAREHGIDPAVLPAALRDFQKARQTLVELARLPD